MNTTTTMMTLLLLCCGIGAFGQTTQTYYYNPAGELVSAAEKHLYYDVVHPRDKDTVYVESFKPEGAMREKGHYTKYGTDDQARQGEHTFYYHDAELVREVAHYQGNAVLSRTTYYKDGATKRQERFDAEGTLLEGRCYNPDGTEREHTPYEVMPSYPGGEMAMLHNLYTQIQYPVLARENGVQGIVVARFVVEKDGSLSNIHIVKGIGGGCDEEVMRVVQLLGNFNPGMRDDEPVWVAFNLPVKFKLEGGNVSRRKKRRGEG